VSNGKILRELDEDKNKAFTAIFGNSSTLTFSPDGKLLLWAGAEVVGQNEVASAMRLWDLTKHQEVRRWEGPADGAAMAPPVFSPDGNSLARSGERGTIHLCEPLSGKELRCLKHECKEGIVTFIFAPDGETLISRASADQTIRVWNPATGEE